MATRRSFPISLLVCIGMGLIDFTGRGDPCDEVLRVRDGLGVQRQNTKLEKMGVTRTFSPRVGFG